jgi:hypothetical protein
MQAEAMASAHPQPTANAVPRYPAQVIDFGFEDQLRRIVNDSHMPPSPKRRTTVSVGCPLPACDKSPLLGLLQVRRLWS